jgi:hypothetical protein
MTVETARITKANQERRGLLPCSLTGTIDPQGAITIPSLFLDVTHFGAGNQGTGFTFELICAGTVIIEYAQPAPQQIVEIKCGLTNFEFLGCEYTREGNTVAADKFRANLGGVEITFKHVKDHKKIVSQLEAGHGVEVTAEAITTAEFSQLSQLEQLVADATILLSYATGTYISWPYRDVYCDGKLICSNLYAVKTGPYVHRNWVIDADNLQACDMKIFLETSYPTFKSLKTDLGLDVVLEFLVVANQGRYFEVTFLLDAVAAECLLSYLSAYFNKIGKKGDMSSFRNKMKELLNHFGVVFKEEELDFIGVRDKIVHTGKFPAEVSPPEATMKLHNLMDRTVLTMLGYRGKFYLNRANHYVRELLQ